jgi:hypothetical protein
MLSGILHNPNLVDVTLPDLCPFQCYRHPAWKREGLAIPSNQVLFFLSSTQNNMRNVVRDLRRFFKVSNARLQKTESLASCPVSPCVHERRAAFLTFCSMQLRCHIMFLVLNAAAACPNFGRRSAQFHYLQPPAQLGITPSKRLLELVSQQPWCLGLPPQRLRQLCCCSPLSTLAARLVRVNDRHEDHRIVESRATALILKRCFSVFAWWVWNTFFNSYSSHPSRWTTAFD